LLNLGIEAACKRHREKCVPNGEINDHDCHCDLSIEWKLYPPSWRKQWTHSWTRCSS